MGSRSVCTVDWPGGSLQVGGDTRVCDVSHAGGTSPLECPHDHHGAFRRCAGRSHLVLGVSGAWFLPSTSRATSPKLVVMSPGSLCRWGGVILPSTTELAITRPL